MNVQNTSSIRSVALGLAETHRILTDEAQEQTAFHQLDVNALESLAHNTWRDMMKWHVLEKLIVGAIV